MQDNTSSNPGAAFILPVVYIAPCPVPLPLWEQMFAGGMNMNKMQTDMKKQFALPYPEDDNEE